MAVSQATANKYTNFLLSKPPAKPVVQKKQPSFLDNLVNNVKQLFNPPAPTSTLPVSTIAKSFQSQPLSINQRLDQAQLALNPYINQTNKTASDINNYLTRFGNPGGLYHAEMGPPSQYTNSFEPNSQNNMAYNSPSQDNSASYLPIIEKLQNQIIQQHTPRAGVGVDLSPYLGMADSIRQQRTTNEQNTLGGLYG